MAKIRTARLSLTMPNPMPASSSPSCSRSSSGSLRSGSPKSPRRCEDLFYDAKYCLGDQRVDAILQTHDPNNPQTPTKTDHSRIGSTSPTSPSFTSLPPFPSSPESTPKHVRDASKSFFSNLKASKSSTKIQSVESTIRQVPQESSESNMWRKKSQVFQSQNNLNSKTSFAPPALEHDGSMVSAEDTNAEDTISPPGGSFAAADEASTAEAANESAPNKSKPKFSSFLKRNASTRIDLVGRKSKPNSPTHIIVPETEFLTNETRSPEGPLTAPLRPDNNLSFHDMMKPPVPRTRSADRRPSPHSDIGEYRSRRPDRSKEEHRGLAKPSSQVFRTDGSGSHFFSGIKNTTTRAAEGIGKAGNRLIGRKITTKPSGNFTKEPEDDRDYMIGVLKLPLIQQTRITRIAKRLENSKDKTEFWMPALPWRCIDYLNYKGCDEEGLYRIPGSGKEIRAWQKRFDTEHDINLFDEDELYDINIIGSMFKAWLRDLPDEIFPKETQDRITSVCTDSSEAPQMLKDELSMLPPWNYYLLFATTCHLSLLHAYVEKNKMSYNNLRICFAPALGIYGDCFRWLVCDWRNCWQGCWTEKQALEEEYRVLDLQRQNVSSPAGANVNDEDRSLSSSGSGKSVQKPPPLAVPHASEESLPRIAGAGHHGRSASQLPELSLPKPISPIFPTNNTN